LEYLKSQTIEIESFDDEVSTAGINLKCLYKIGIDIRVKRYIKHSLCGHFLDKRRNTMEQNGTHPKHIKHCLAVKDEIINH
jgi:hypothetical protein